MAVVDQGQAHGADLERVHNLPSQWLAVCRYLIGTAAQG